MKKIILSAFITLIVITANAQLPTLEWAKQMRGNSTETNHNSIALDTKGNVYTTGFFNGTVDFDPGEAIFNLTSNDDGYQYNIFILKLDSAGNFVWAKNIGGTGNIMASSIALDAMSNIYVAGNYNGITDFNPDAGIFNLTAQGKSEAFILKLDSSGNFGWAKTMVTKATGTSRANAIAISERGDVYTTGGFTDTIDFDPGISVFNLISSKQDIFIAKLDTAGNFIWAKQIGSSYDEGLSITIDHAENVYTTGSFQNTADFNPGVGTYNITSIGTQDIFISKLNSAGEFIWAKNIGGTDFSAATSIAVDPFENIYTTGWTTGTVDFDPGIDTFNLPSVMGSYYNGFISKLDSAGNFVWAKNTNVGWSIKLDARNNIYTGGDAFISKTDIFGNLIWEADMGLSSVNYSIAIDTAENVYSTGYFRGTVDFDFGAGTFNLTSFDSTAGMDIFVQKINHIITITTPSGINESDNTDNISIYPNPTTSQLTINFDAIETNASLEIKNLLGQTVYAQTIKNLTGKQSKSIDLSAFSEGVYFIQLKNKNSVSSKKFMKE